MQRTVKLGTLTECAQTGMATVNGVLTGLYKLGKCYIMVGNEPQGWHLSISHPDRYPSWDEITTARYQLVPNEVTMSMILPPKEEYVNLHENCFHLWQIEGD